MLPGRVFNEHQLSGSKVHQMWQHDSTRVLDQSLDLVQRNDASIKSLLLNSPAVVVARADTNFAWFPLLWSSKWIDRSSTAKVRAELLTPQKVGFLPLQNWKEKKPSSQNQGDGRAGTRDWMKSFLMLGFTLISKHSARSLDANQAVAHASKIKPSFRNERKDGIICLSDFFLDTEWALDVAPRHLFQRLEAQHTRESWIIYRNKKSLWRGRRKGDSNNAIIFKFFSRISSSFPLCCACHKSDARRRGKKGF